MESPDYDKGIELIKRKRTKCHRGASYSHPVEKEDYLSTTTEEDEDTAHCLILLAQGRRSDAAAYAYSCKTCNRCFPSFQALGGHRASHKKPKLAPTTMFDTVMNTSVKPNRFRAHECSVCGSEFASGQALGGHMRRHRPVGPAEPDRRSALPLDLNLPPAAPSEESGFGLCARGPMAALVDCHY